MRVLVACEESQTVCKAFRERGHKDENGKAISWDSAETKRIRSKTYDGIAQAMAEQWGNCMNYYEEEYEQVSFMEV